MSDGIKLDFKVHITTGQCGSRVMHAGERAAPPAITEGRVPRISRLMALAIRFDDLVRSGEMADFAEIAELGQVTRGSAATRLCLGGPALASERRPLEYTTSSGRMLYRVRTRPESVHRHGSILISAC